jgi:hypothetical protein
MTFFMTRYENINNYTISSCYIGGTGMPPFGGTVDDVRDDLD